MRLALALALAAASAASVPPVVLGSRAGARLPLALRFRDETGRSVRLSDYFGRKPVILALVYYECPALCTEELNGLVRALRALSFDAGREYSVIAVSFDPRETPALAAAKKKTYVERYGRPGTDTGWTFLTGERASIRRLTRATGFRYLYDPASRQFSHATGLIVLTPGGRIWGYLDGVEFAAGDVRRALVEAGEGRIGTPVDRLIVYCFRYDPATGRLGARVMHILQVFAAATALALGAGIAALRRRERA